MIRRVVKVGGSLLASPQLQDRLRSWCIDQPAAINLVIVGGGSLIDSVRHLDQLHKLDPQWAHWFCVDLLDATFKLAGELIPEWNQLNSGDVAELIQGCDSSLTDQASQSEWNLVGVTSFYNQNQSGDLPTDWRTTTDSIAARLAELTRSSELVLLKSCDVASNQAIDQLAADGIVDKAFPTAARLIPRIRIERLP